MLRRTGGRREVRGHGGQPLDELRRGAATAADDLHAQLLDEAALVGLQLLGGQVVVHLAIDDGGQTGVGQHRDRDPGVLGEVADVLAHLGGAGGAVEPDDVDVQRVDGGERSADLGAHQHAPSELHGDLGLDGDLAADLGHGPARGDDRGLQGQQVEVGLQDEQVDPALQQRLGGHLVVVAQLGEADLAQAGGLGAGAEGAGHVALAIRRGEAVGHLPGDAGVGQGDLVGPVGHVVLAEGYAEGAEGVGLHHIGADLQVCGVQRRDHVGPGDAQVVGAAFVDLAAVVVEGEVLGLQPGAGGAVVDDDALAHQVEER